MIQLLNAFSNVGGITYAFDTHLLCLSFVKKKTHYALHNSGFFLIKTKFLA